MLLSACGAAWALHSTGSLSASPKATVSSPPPASGILSQRTVRSVLQNTDREPGDQLEVAMAFAGGNRGLGQSGCLARFALNKVLGNPKTQLPEGRLLHQAATTGMASLRGQGGHCKVVVRGSHPTVPLGELVEIRNGEHENMGKLFAGLAP
jgi:hypothetical protein